MTMWIGLFNLFCVWLMFDLYFRQEKGSWHRKVTVTIGATNLVGAFVNLIL
ncbi:hypothetical protein LCGC14_2767510 [marine sediment metagenome]|uniref:Uncharacterized protein n=1 Tax=marine sediment metagenome TaxID=412755 RepID=A0A0F9BNT2_9ZZZZ